MKLDKIILLLKRLYKNYVRKHLDKIFMSLFFSVLLAGTTSAIAWLLDPAVKKIFIENDKTYSWLIPILIVLAFSTKGISLYFARSDGDNTITIEGRITGSSQHPEMHHILCQKSASEMQIHIDGNLAASTSDTLKKQTQNTTTKTV